MVLNAGLPQAAGKAQLAAGLLEELGQPSVVRQHLGWTRAGPQVTAEEKAQGFMGICTMVFH